MFPVGSQGSNLPTGCYLLKCYTVPNWLNQVSSSFASQASTWFVGFLLAVLGVFSGRIVETIKFSLNRADLRAKYYEEMAIDVSHFVFIIDRLIRVYYQGTWASDESKSAIASEYDEVTNTLRRKEYVYRSWLSRYWGKSKAQAFDLVMGGVTAVDAELIRLNESGVEKPNESQLQPLKNAYESLRGAARALLIAG